ncbi:MAG: hypothetical protein HYV52_02140 [Parcubacteria group bacterium]|nr:hypothetical protein [Parcubacteria group bacterium]
MTKNIILILAIILVVGGLGYYSFYGSSSSPSSSATTPLTSPESSAKEWNVIYENNKFNPDSLKIKFGDIVIFENLGDFPMWPASNPHPAHSDLAGFDALRGYIQNESYKFVFTQKGAWSYHNHLNPEAGGKIIVE